MYDSCIWEPCLCVWLESCSVGIWLKKLFKDKKKLRTLKYCRTRGLVFTWRTSDNLLCSKAWSSWYNSFRPTLDHTQRISNTFRASSSLLILCKCIGRLSATRNKHTWSAWLLIQFYYFNALFNVQLKMVLPGSSGILLPADRIQWVAWQNPDTCDDSFKWDQLGEYLPLFNSITFGNSHFIKIFKTKL